MMLPVPQNKFWLRLLLLQSYIRLSDMILGFLHNDSNVFKDLHLDLFLLQADFTF